jgi:hypothetical protein
MAAWSSTVFARELPPRSAGFNAEIRLYLFALTMPPGEHPSTHEEREVVTGLHSNGDGGRPTPGFNRRGVGQSHDLCRRRPREQMCDWTFDSPAKRPSAGKQSLVSRFSRKTTPPSVESRRVRGASREGGDDKKIRTGTNAAPSVQAELV